jgi:methyltransferase (TIGR00027 family)
MRNTQASSTAIATAAVRAIESEKPSHKRICNDPFARALTSSLAYFLIKLFYNYGERRTRGALTFIVCRQRFIDDFLDMCLHNSTMQVVILGAGLDSRAYRHELSDAKVFEVDHPATQSRKTKRVTKIFGKLPDHITYVPIDFDRETLDKLLSYGFEKTAKTLFIWEGVTPYITAEAVDATLSWIRSNSAIRSAIVFDYRLAVEERFDPERGFLSHLLSRLSGENRRVFSIAQGSIVDFLTKRGFSNVVVAGSEKLKSLYCIGPNQGRDVLYTYSIVCAEVI